MAHFSSKLREDFRPASLTRLPLDPGSLAVPAGLLVPIHAFDWLIMPQSGARVNGSNGFWHGLDGFSQNRALRGSRHLRRTHGAWIMGVMQATINLGGRLVRIDADEVSEQAGSARIRGERVAVHLPEPPVRYFRHGWQSWSLAAWTPVSGVPGPRPKNLRLSHEDIVYADEILSHGSGLGAVEFEDGRVLLLGALGLGAHIRLNADALEGWCEAGTLDWMAAFGPEKQVFSQYAERLGQVLGRRRSEPAPRVWCSWYTLYSAIDEAILGRVLHDLGDLPFDVFLVDDGWERAIGDWEPNAKFPSGMAALAEKIRKLGLRAGLWLAPLLAARSSFLFRDHPDRMLRDEQGRLVKAGMNWGQRLYALDTSNPAVLDWLAGLMRQVRGWGYDYVKLDFLYAGALSGKRRGGEPREQSYRRSLEVMRDALGEDAYLVACGAPIFPSLGIADALRVGPDTAGEWEIHRDAVLLSSSSLPGAKNALRTTLHELWLKPLMQVDPDVCYFTSRHNSLTPEQRQLLQDLALICGFKSTSDLPQWLSPGEREALRQFLEDPSQPVQEGRYTFRIGERPVDFSPFVDLPSVPTGLDRIRAPLFGWAADQLLVMRVFDRMQRRSLEQRRKELEQ